MTATTSEAAPLRVLAVSGSRADWGYLVKPIEALKADPAFDVLLAATGQHLEERSGRTIDNIRNAGNRRRAASSSRTLRVTVRRRPRRLWRTSPRG